MNREMRSGRLIPVLGRNLPRRTVGPGCVRPLLAGILAVVTVMVGGCERSEPAAEANAGPWTLRSDPQSALAVARRGRAPAIRPLDQPRSPAPTPPTRDFTLVKYPSDVGSLSAYVTPDPGDGRRHSAIVWITGGDCNSIGPVWDAAPPDNDQTASAYRKAGIVMMFPSLRGGNDNPGEREGWFGEAEDVLAAGDYLRSLPYVDPDRVYLGGHSTGGTLALLVAESSPRFRAVFSFGPVSDVRGYPDEYVPFDDTDDQQARLRAPVNWMNSVRCRTYVFEGSEGNRECLREMQFSCQNSWLRFFEIRGQDHFTILDPVNRLIAKKILQDREKDCFIAFTDEEIAALFPK